eukprot:gene5015-10037_t
MSEFRPDHLLVRDYVMANDHLQYSLLPEDVAAVLITHSNLSAKHLDIRLNLHLTISDVKDKLRTHLGTPPEHQRLVLKRDGLVIGELNDDRKMLGFYSVVSGMEIHVIDTDPFSLSRNGGLTDTTLIEKYKISEEAYDKRKGTVRDWIKQKKKADPNFKAPKPTGAAGSPANFVSMSANQSASELENEYGIDSVAGITVGARCEAAPGGRRGVVKFVGEIDGMKAGHWVGVQFDEPVGLHDGSAKGKKIFECPDGYGTFVRGKNMKVGDFPMRDLLDSEDENEGTQGQKEEVDEDEI